MVPVNDFLVPTDDGFAKSKGRSVFVRGQHLQLIGICCFFHGGLGEAGGGLLASHFR